MFHVQKDKLQEIPFREGKILRVQVGFLVDKSEQQRFRYTCPLEPVRGHYRITLQRMGDESYATLVFDVRKPSADAPLEISPDSEDARTLWNTPDQPLWSDVKNAVEVVFREDIEAR